MLCKGRLRRRIQDGLDRSLLVLSVLLAGLLGLSACSEVWNNPSAPVVPAAKVHPEDWLDPTKAEFHGQAIRLASWDMEGCKRCHGVAYSGGTAGRKNACLNCHARTPESCNVCHGTGNRSHPPEDTRGNVATDSIGVGAHQAHSRESATALAFGCYECHHLPESFDDPAHRDGDGRAEIIWGELARSGGAEPQYEAGTGTCAGTYCHRGGRLGNQLTVVWTEVGRGQGACGTCHGLPPAAETGHPEAAANSCADCHGSVVDEDNNIVDKSLHLNGKPDF